MPGMVWKGGGYRYGFNGQEKSPEIDDGHTTAMYWEYDARTAMRWNTDPVVMPGLSPYATFEGNPILYSDPNGDCPTCPDGDETYRKGSTVSNKDGSWEYLGNHKWKTLSLNMGNSTAGFQSYYNQAGGASAVDAVGDQIYQGKLSAYTNNFAKGVYGQNQDGSVAVPQAIQDRLRNEANAEAFDSFKAIYAMEKSGQDPSSFNYFANPLARAMYAGARANAVTGQGEAVGMIKGVALDVALQYVGRINFPALRPVTAHITKFIQGHTTPWAMMTKAEMKAFQHSYSRHAAELGLPNWSQSKGAGLQELFNREVTIIRNAGANGFFRSQELVNGVRITVNRTNPVINGQRYFYYETRQGKFVSAGKMP